MEIDSSQLPPSSASLTLPSSDKSSVLSSDFETFLKMLTAQAKYQDPLEPIDSSEYAAQLAQFSMVEQQVKSNDLLSALADKLGSSNMADLASWIGMEARTALPADHEGSPITVVPKPTEGADEMYLSVYDSSGSQVQKLMLENSNEQFEWAGLDDSGQPLPQGTYTLTLEFYSEGQQISSAPAEIYTRVTEARQNTGEAQVVLAGGVAVPTSSITALREAR